MITSAGLAFIAGLLAPLGAICVLPLYPGYLSWLANQVGEKDDKTLHFKFSLIVIVGLIFSFLITGLVFTWFLKASVSAAIGTISMIAFVILAVVSACLILDIDLTAIIPSPKLLHPVNPYQGALLFGLFFGLVILPCNPAPVILLFALSINASDFLENILILVMFCIGIAIPVLLISIIPAVSNSDLAGFMKTNRRVINTGCGIFMLFLSLYYLFWVFELHRLLLTYITSMDLF